MILNNYTDMDADTIGARMWKARKMAGISQVEIGEILGLYPNNISRFENDQQDVKSKHIALFCKHLNINPTWLITGKGQMMLHVSKTGDQTLEYGLDDLIHLDISGLIRKIQSMDKKMEMMDGELKILKGKMG